MSIYKSLKSYIKDYRKKQRIKKYKSGGAIPWATGYEDFKELTISGAINDQLLLQGFENKKVPEGYGIGIDERVVEYPWIFSQLASSNQMLLDAGSTFNFEYILNQQKLHSKKIHICTFHPEASNYNNKGVSYVYSDIRDLPYKDNLFEEVVCQSTIEHIDMDNSIYGYAPDKEKDGQQKSYSYLEAVKELIRVVKPGGIFLLTFPYGKFENHVFFQQFDSEMLYKIENLFSGTGEYEISFIRYLKSGWVFAGKEECADIESYNPHTGKGKGEDGAAHCRCVCLIKFKKH